MLNLWQSIYIIILFDFILNYARLTSPQGRRIFSENIILFDFFMENLNRRESKL